MAYRTYSPNNGFLVAQNGTGDFTTIQAAINAAAAQITGGPNAGYTISIADGTYIENPVLQPGIDLVAQIADAYEPNVIIQGNVSFSGSGSCTLSGIEFQTNSGFALSVTGSNASNLTLINCLINCSSGTGINLASSNSSSQISLYYCNMTLSGSNAFFSLSGLGILRFEFCTAFNNSATPISSTCSSGTFLCYYSLFTTPLVFSGTVTTVFLYSFLVPGNGPIVLNLIPVTYGNSGNNSAQYSHFGSIINTASSSAITINDPSSAVMDSCLFYSSGTNAITGTGSLIGSNLTFGTSSGINVTTQSLSPFIGGLSQVVLPSTSYQVLNTDYFIGVNTSGTRNITLPATPGIGQRHTIADVTGTASTHNITVIGNGSNILGSTSAANYVMNNNGQSDTFIYIGSIWKVI